VSGCRRTRPGRRHRGACGVGCGSRWTTRRGACRVRPASAAPAGRPTGAAVRSVRAHWAARIVAHSDVQRGSRAPVVGPMSSRLWIVTPSTRCRRLPIGRATSMESVVEPLIPAAMSADAPSRVAPAPASHTARHHNASPSGALVPMTTVRRPAVVHRPAVTSERTSSRLTPAARRSRRCTTPPWFAARRAPTAARWARETRRRGSADIGSLCRSAPQVRPGPCGQRVQRCQAHRMLRP
jgi:hypothetical protein